MEAQLVEAFSTVQASSMKKIKKTIKFISKCKTAKVIRKINMEFKNMKLKYAENVHRGGKKFVLPDKSNLNEQNQRSREFIVSSKLELFKTFKSHDFIYNACYEEIKLLISLLLSEDIKCMGEKLLEVCSKITLQLTCDEVIEWCDANLNIDDFKCDVSSKLKQSVKVVENVVTIDFSVSHVINFFRRLAVKIHSKSIHSLPEEIFQMLTVARCFVKHNYILESTKKILTLIVIDVYIGLLTFAPELCCDKLNDSFINLFSNCPNHDITETSFLCHQHVKMLLSSVNFAVSWSKYTSIINILMCAKVFKVKELKKCLKGLKKNNWNGLDLYDPFNYLKSMLKDFEEKHAEDLSK